MNKKALIISLIALIALATPIASHGQAGAKRSQPRSVEPRPPAAPPPPVSAPTKVPAPSRAPAAATANAPNAASSSAAAAQPSSELAPEPTFAPQESAAAGGDDNDNQIIPAPTMLSYSEVKDNFGRRIADTYAVVQVSIKNPDIEHQFLLQDLRIVFDPNECDNAKEFYEHFDVQACRDRYDKYLRYPIAYAPISQSALQAVATIGQSQNPRNFGFRLLDFAATMGGALTGFNFVGRDGKAGLGVFNGTFLTASKTFLPDLTIGQLTQLTEQSYKPNTLVESKDTKTYNVFIPTSQLFSKDTWKLYKQKTRDESAEALEMRRLLQLVLTVTASGIHIKQADNAEPPVTRGSAARLTPAELPQTPPAERPAPTPVP